MRGKLVFSGSEIEVVMVAAAFQPRARFSFIGNKAVETRAQKRLEAGFAGVVSGEVILFERVREEALRQIFGVFVAGVPLQADVLVRGFPVARENRVEGATADELIVAASVADGGVIGDRKFVKRSADVSIRITHWTGFTRFLQDVHVYPEKIL